MIRIDTDFSLPSPLPTFPPGEGFASGVIDLGGLRVRQISKFNKVWTTHSGGPDDIGATFFEPSPVPEGYFMLGHYSQPNNKPLFGWTLVAKDDNGDLLKKPIDYTLVWSSESLKIKQDGNGYIWLPVAPDGYKAVGLLVTISPEKPPLDKVRCIRDDFTDQCEADKWIWGQGKEIDRNGFNVFGSRPINRASQSLSVEVSTFLVSTGENAASLSLVCLKNMSTNYVRYMPNLSQIETLVQSYAPLVYLHSDEEYLPSTVSWFFENGALLYKQGEESNPVPVSSSGSNLPQDGSNDGAYWLDLPVDGKAKDMVKRGNLQSSGAYLHVKPMRGGTFTDLAIWIFYPFNGPARAKVEIVNIPLGKIGEHVGDWEHLTLRVSNFNGELRSMFLSEHSGGTWMNSSELEFGTGNKPVAYASLHGHALYPKFGTVLQGNGRIGIRNDTEKSRLVVDTGVRLSVVAAEYLGLTEPPWLSYTRKWGPKISYDLQDEINKLKKVLPGPLKSRFEKFVKSLPAEVLGEDGPTGPKVKGSWNGDEG